jgi:hypothetical protein
VCGATRFILRHLHLWTHGRPGAPRRALQADRKAWLDSSRGGRLVSPVSGALSKFPPCLSCPAHRVYASKATMEGGCLCTK